jgi:tripartite ATP-independent transporter DctM subunit
MEMVGLYFFLFIFFIVLKVPVAFSLGITTTFMFYLTDIPVAAIPQRLFSGTGSFTLVAIPFFILAGELMSSGGILNRIFDFCRILVSRLKGGFYHINILVSMIFGGLNGSAVADTSACGSLLIKPTIKEYNDPELVAALTAASSVVGPIIPPSIPMLIYVFAAGNVSVSAMFAAGIVPGIMVGLSMMLVTWLVIRNKQLPANEELLSLKQKLVIFRRFLVAFTLPVIMIGGIVSGIFTPTEAGCVAVLYALFIGLFVTRELTAKSIYAAFYRTVLISAMVLIMVAVAKVSTYWLTLNDVPFIIADFMQTITTSPLGFLFLLVIFYLIIGLFIEQAAAIIMLVPVFLPISMSYGIDPIHFGIVTIVSLALGLITPPVGLCVYISSGIAGTQVESVFRRILPFLGIQFFILILLTIFPQIFLWVPKLLGLI